MSLRLALPSEGALFEGAAQFMASCGSAGFAGEFHGVTRPRYRRCQDSRCCTNGNPI